MKTIEEPTMAATKAPDEMVAAFKYEKKEGPTFLDTGTKGANFLSTQFVQANGIHTCKTVGYVKVRHRFRRYSSDETCLA
jgi:hypothetical protein